MDFSGYITLVYPQALCLGLLLGYLYFRRLRTRNLWRLFMLVCTLLLLGYPVILHKTDTLDLYLVVDRSRSVSGEAREKEREMIDLVSRNLKSGDRLSIISFNEKPFVELPPGGEASFKSFRIPYSEDYSDLTEGVQTALSIADPVRNSRVFLLTDGEYTGANPLRAAQLARQKKIPIFHRNLKRSAFFNLTVREIDTPGQILEREPFRVIFKITSTVDTPGRFRIYRDGKITGPPETEGWQNIQFRAGENRIPFQDSLRNPGIHSYRIEVESIPGEKENIRKDNFAERFVKVVGERPILLVNNNGGRDNVSAILAAGGLKSHIASIDNFHLDINRMEGYKGIILNNVPLLGLTRKQIRDLRDFVVEGGGGLLVCGGNRSFASGGYYKTALDLVLPVSLEDRKQSKKVSTAFCIVLDRSGSMQMPTASGRTKMTLANNAAVECLNLLTPVDSISVIAVDSLAHIIVPLQSAENTGYIASRVKSIESMGGGIFVYTGLAAAGRQIVGAPQLNKHILLFSDANDSEEPGDYRELLKNFTDVGITVSVVGLGTESDRDAAFLKDVAARGNGEIYFTNDASQLIQFFTADTITFIRKSFIEEETPMEVRSGALTISPSQNWDDFSCSGFNLLFSRPRADIAIQTSDEDAAPVLSFWQRGLGRVAALALDPEGDFASTNHYGDIVLSVTRWIMGSRVFDNLQIKTGYEGTVARVSMEVSGEEREKLGSASVTFISPGGETKTRPLLWESYNRLSAEYNLTEPGCHRGIVRVGGNIYKTGPLSMPVSPEFVYSHDPEFGRRTLGKISSLTGGKEILDVRDLFQRTRRSTASTPVVAPFLLAFLLLLVTDIAEARFGILSFLAAIWRRQKKQLAALRQVAYRKAGARPRQRKKGEETFEEPEEPPKAKETAPEKKPDMDYLSDAKKEVQKRFRQKP